MSEGGINPPQVLSVRAVLFLRFVVGFLAIVGFLTICYIIFVLVYVAVEEPFT